MNNNTVRHMFRYLFIIILLLHNSITIFPEGLPIAAVTNIKGTEVSLAVAAACRNIVETALIKTKMFSVLSYTDIEEILAAQEYSLRNAHY